MSGVSARYQSSIVRFRNHLNADLGSCLFKAFGLDTFFNKVITHSQSVSIGFNTRNAIFNRFGGANATHGKGLAFVPDFISIEWALDERMQKPSSLLTADYLTLIHETVHSIDYRKGWYIGVFTDLWSAEGLAWTSEQQLRELRLFADKVKTKECRTLQRLFASQCTSFPEKSASVTVGAESRPVTAENIADVAAKLGLKFNQNAVSTCLRAICPNNSFPQLPVPIPGVRREGWDPNFRDLMKRMAY